MAALKQFDVRLKNEIYSVMLYPQDTLGDLKDIIYAITDIEPYRQNFSNLPPLANVWDDSFILQNLHLDPGFVFEMNDLCELSPTTSGAEASSSDSNNSNFSPIAQLFQPSFGIDSEMINKEVFKPRDGKEFGVLCEPLASISSPTAQIFQWPPEIGGGDQLVVEEEEFKPLDAPRDGKELVALFEPLPSTSSPIAQIFKPPPEIGGGDQLVIKENGFKPLNAPRAGKKLVVLDVDLTIYDCLGPTMHLRTRPHLQLFLEGLYLDYDIGIWSATTMSVLEHKMKRLGMTTSPHYKLVFLMDKDSMISVPIEGETYWVKPLDFVWSKYQQFSKENTLICDDVQVNFYLNPANGILVHPYCYKEHHKDRELLKLLAYLKVIVKYDNLSIIDHSKWNQWYG